MVSRKSKDVIEEMTDVIIVGAGIVGLATAYQLLSLNPDFKIRILEKECKAALHQSSRNSGVIHSGIYYKPNSLKAVNCIQGKKELVDFAQKYQIATKKLGKVIVASKLSQVTLLEDLFKRGKENKVGKIELIDSNRLKEIEPNVEGVKAIWLPDVMVTSFKDIAEKLAKIIDSSQSEIMYNQKVVSINSFNNEAVVKTEKGYFRANKVINCAGLFSDRLVNSRKKGFRIVPFRGEYFEIMADKQKLINGLVYPVKDPRFPFLGVHLTKTVDGKLEAGPNAVLAYAREGYNKKDISFVDLKDILTHPGFWKMAKKYWRVGLYELYRSYFKNVFLKDLQEIMPSIQKDDLRKASSGIRAQVVLNDGTLTDDFIFEKDDNVLHVINAPSPAATSAFSIGRAIAKKALEN